LQETLYGDDLLPLYAPFLVQLVANNGACVEARYESRVKTSTYARLSAQPDAP